MNYKNKNKDAVIIYNEIIDKYLNCAFISDENKKLLYSFKQYLNFKKKGK